MGRPVLSFALTSLLALAILIAAGTYLVRREGATEAVRDARNTTQLLGTGVVEPALTGAMLDGDPQAMAEFDALIQERVLSDDLIRVKVWTPEGRIAYSDEPRLIDRQYTLGTEEKDVLADGGVEAEVSDLTRPENTYEADQGKLLEVYLPLRADDGRQVLFETYHRARDINETARAIWQTFLPLVLGVLVLLWLIQLPLAWRMASKLAHGRREKEALLAHAVEASDAERSRIAADLHDGPVQDLAGLAFALEAAAGKAAAGETASLEPALRDAAGRTRQSMRGLRSLLVELHPPNLATVGLESALSDLIAPLAARGVETQLEIDLPQVADETEALLFRVAQEALRNVAVHADASRVEVRAERVADEVWLVVEDDGRGMQDGARERAREEGHLGLSLTEELVAQHGGRMSVHPGPRRGTVVEVAIPCR